MKMMKRSLVSLAVASAMAVPAISHATNGMNIDGYGPIAAAMGGTSMAHDTGTAAMMNNPATLGMGGEGMRLDVAVGWLGPDVDASFGPFTDTSGGDSYFMPAAGFTRKTGQLTYGVGMFAQGGMGTEWGPTSFLAMGSGFAQRSEVGVGRLILPLAFDVNDKLTIAGSIDYVWAGMDLKMAMPGATILDFMPAFANPFATRSLGVAGGTLLTNPAFGAIGGAIGADATSWAAFSFSDSSDFTGAANGDGWGGKLGLTYKVSDRLTIGATYHTETDLDDLEDNGATFTVNAANIGGPGVNQINLTGNIAIRDFQWPATVAVGAAYQVNDRLMLAGDVKHIKWSDVMKNFTMTWTAHNNATNTGFGIVGNTLDFTMYQNWDDQNVLQLGGAYKVTDAFTVRGGVSLSDNPVPSTYLNYLFPAIIEDHMSVGFGYQFSDVSEINFSYTKSLGVTQTNTNPLGGYSTSHEQDNWQLMYTHRF